MTTVTLATLLEARDESLRYVRAKPSALARIMRRARAIDLAPARRRLLVSLLFVTTFAIRHALVLAGCAAVVISAAIVTPALGWLALAAALFFLEARRR